MESKKTLFVEEEETISFQRYVGYEDIQVIHIPEGVKVIEGHSFEGFPLVDEIHIPTSLTLVNPSFIYRPNIYGANKPLDIYYEGDLDSLLSQGKEFCDFLNAMIGSNSNYFFRNLYVKFDNHFVIYPYLGLKEFLEFRDYSMVLLNPVEINPLKHRIPYKNADGYISTKLTLEEKYDYINSPFAIILPHARRLLCEILKINNDTQKHMFIIILEMLKNLKLYPLVEELENSRKLTPGQSNYYIREALVYVIAQSEFLTKIFNHLNIKVDYFYGDKIVIFKGSLKREKTLDALKNIQSRINRINGLPLKRAPYLVFASEMGSLEEEVKKYFDACLDEEEEYIHDLVFGK